MEITDDELSDKEWLVILIPNEIIRRKNELCDCDIKYIPTKSEI
jgi:hypothetical protein